MSVTVLRALAATAIAAALLGALTPAAAACTVVPQYRVDPSLLIGDFTAVDSGLNVDYRTWRGFPDDQAVTIEILGAYVFETVHWVDETSDLSAGSVSVLTEVWGQWPADRAPRMVATGDKASGDGCQPRPAGPVGTRSYWLVTSDGVLPVGVVDASMPALTAAFGAPETAPRDFDLEAQLISQLQTADTGSSVPLILGGVGVGALLLAGAFWKYTRRPPASTQVS